ncbi:PQQ-dependent sugar dehydrogenase [Constantimarinum furrinae]|uniref:Glucose/sorbosone dehydrogenase n=1 Tax=Constantimarinum furrinae TaxID=2562285 RepID=A0A7G8PVQ1_9FLAO|nr:PQQ-dependent sugar dehydrogenase [Constantimarinum furrinae]QNJ98417.1 Glucose/sorbosone dehydrogenase [Constantimarinum furrinae]
MKNVFLFTMSVFFVLSCAEQKKENDVAINTKTRTYSIETVVDNLSNPWGMTWLPDGSMLITEKSGELIHFKDGIKTDVKNVPEVYDRGQGGLLDIKLHPNYTQKGWIYITYASSEGDKNGGNTALIRCKLDNFTLTNIEKLYKATPNTTRGQHFGSRIEFDNEGYLYFTIGERGDRDVNPQDITRDGGKVYRLNDDGSIPADNPFVNEPGAKKAIYTFGNRNPQGMVKHPETGQIWIHEHGPKGGDEINIVKKGANYGWPVISYGVNYSGTKFTEETSRPGMEQPIYYWTPSIAPCGMDFVTGNRYPDWKGHLLVGSLKFNYVELVKLNGDKVIDRLKIAEDVGRVRNVKMGPDGYIYIGLEGRGIVKIIPN